MEKKDNVFGVDKCELLEVFIKEEDRKGTDILAMSNFFDVFIEKIDAELNLETSWEVCPNIEGLFGQIATAIKGGFDISERGMLVADYSHFNKEIMDGLEEGIYHIGESKEVAGNLRPAILDKDGQLVKFFTLKKVINPIDVLSDISTLSMQISLKKISSQIQNVGRNVEGMIDVVRRETLSNKFICARDRIMSASTADLEEQKEFLKAADTYLMEGLTALYSDVNAQVKKLADHKGLFASIKEIDTLLSYINEDMLMIPRYVGLRVYLLNFRGKIDDASRILGDYRYQLKTLLERKIGEGKYTALELIHENYPYDDKNRDFWLEKPKQMLKAIDSYETMLEQNNRDVFCIIVEEMKNE